MITPITVFFPLVGAVLMLLMKSADERTTRYTALGVAAVPLLLSLYIYFAHGTDLGATSLTQSFDWVASLGIGYRVGLDGLGFGMFFLSALLTLIAVVASWDVSTLGVIVGAQYAFLTIALIAAVAIAAVAVGSRL